MKLDQNIHVLWTSYVKKKQHCPLWVVSHQRTFISADSQYASEQYLTSAMLKQCGSLMSNNWCTREPPPLSRLSIRGKIRTKWCADSPGLNSPCPLRWQICLNFTSEWGVCGGWRLARAGRINIWPFLSDLLSLLSTLLRALKDSVFMNYLSLFENIKLVMSLSCVLSPRAS